MISALGTIHPPLFISSRKPSLTFRSSSGSLRCPSPECKCAHHGPLWLKRSRPMSVSLCPSTPAPPAKPSRVGTASGWLLWPHCPAQDPVTGSGGWGGDQLSSSGSKEKAGWENPFSHGAQGPLLLLAGGMEYIIQ